MNELKMFAAQIVVVLLLLLFQRFGGQPSRVLADASRRALPSSKRNAR